MVKGSSVESAAQSLAARPHDQAVWQYALYCAGCAASFPIPISMDTDMVAGMRRHKPATGGNPDAY